MDQPINYQPSPSSVKKPEKKRKAQNGSLTVHVQSGYGVYPLEGALVTVYTEQGDGGVIAQSLTDESGNTPRIELSAGAENDRSDLLPGGQLFTIETSKEGYQSVVYRNVQLYPLIETLLNVNLSALPDVPGKKITPYDGEIIL